MTNSRGFPDLVLKAATDDAFRERLFSRPREITRLFALNEAEEASLEKLTPQKLDAIVGSLLAHKVLPRKVSKRFTVTPSGTGSTQWLDTITIKIDQRKTGVSIGKDGLSIGDHRAFGSGIHSTTYLCLYALEDHFTGSSTLLDVGTGSGILSIAAAKLGASSVLAMDVDEDAIDIARENVSRNKVEHIIRLEQGSIDQIDNGRFDFIIANVVSSVHLGLLRDGLLELLSPGGKLVLSGIQDGEREIMLAGIRSAMGIVVDGYLDRGWIAFVISHGAE